MSHNSNINIIYAAPDQIISLDFPHTPGLTAEQALIKSGILNSHPDLKININNLSNLNLGIFSEKIDLAYVLQPDDRLEIYRNLIADPKIKRQERVKPMGKWHRARTGTKIKNPKS